MRSRFRRAVVVAVAALGALGAAEAVARLLGEPSGPAPPKPPQIEGPRIRTPDPDLGWRLLPSLVTTHRCVDYAVTYRTNAQGARASRDYAAARAPGRTRVLVYGDSFVFGVGVDEEQRFTDLLAASRPDLEVLNLGVSGYGTDQALLRLEREGAAYAPDLVLLGHLMEHASRNLAFEHRAPSGAPGEVRVDPKPRFLLGPEGLRLANTPVPPPRTEQATAAPPSPSWLRRLRLFSLAADRWSAFERRRHPFPEWEAGAEGRALTEAIVERFAASVRAIRAEPLVVVLGDRTYLDGRFASLADRRPVGRFVEFCRSRSIPVVDLLPAFDAAAGDGKDPLFFPWDGHWTARAHRIAAEALARCIEERRPVASR
ncbi:MAG TPA: hypothetical protein VFI25_01795 [Planctomycetota bacterium]|nr:hypothetical protein [Planctomycetota bacterium]